MSDPNVQAPIRRCVGTFLVKTVHDECGSIAVSSDSTVSTAKKLCTSFHFPYFILLTTFIFRMSVFLSKHPSSCPRVLDATDCPPHNILHDIQTYPLFYDALYYPQYTESVYATAEKFCCWLQLSLASHCNSLCLRCGPLYRSVAVVFDGVGLSSVDDISMTFTRAHFESAAYMHCSVFKRFKIYQEAAQQGTPLPTAALCITSRLKDGFLTQMLAMQRMCLLCPRLFCVMLHCELELKDQMREIRNVVSM